MGAGELFHLNGRRVCFGDKVKIKKGKYRERKQATWRTGDFDRGIFIKETCGLHGKQPLVVFLTQTRLNFRLCNVFREELQRTNF